MDRRDGEEDPRHPRHGRSTDFCVAAPGGDANQREEHGDDARKQIAFGFGKTRAIEPHKICSRTAVAYEYTSAAYIDSSPRPRAICSCSCTIAYGSRNGTVTAATRAAAATSCIQSLVRDHRRRRQISQTT